MQECDELLNNLAAQQNEIGEEARNCREAFDTVADAVKHQADGISPNEALQLAEKFFRVTSQIYTLAAMAPPAANPAPAA